MPENREPLGTSEALFVALVSQGCSAERAARIAGAPAAEDFLLPEIDLTRGDDRRARERNPARSEI